MVKLYNPPENRLKIPRRHGIMAEKSRKEVYTMPRTNQERNRYQEDYKRENYDIIKVLTPKGTRERLKAEAARRGLSVSMLILQALAQILPPDEFPADPPEPSGQIPEDAGRETATPTGAED